MSQGTPFSVSLANARGGDAAAFQTLLEPCRLRLAAFLRRHAGRSRGGDADEDDLLQIVLAEAWRRLGGCEDRGPEAFFRWLVAIARHVIHDRLKYLAAKGRAQLQAPAEPAPWSQVAGSHTSVAGSAMRNESLRRLDEAFTRLEPRQRDVVGRHLLEGATLGEIAAALGITKNAVWERLHRGLAALRLELGATP